MRSVRVKDILYPLNINTIRNLGEQLLGRAVGYWGNAHISDKGNGAPGDAGLGDGGTTNMLYYGDIVEVCKTEVRFRHPDGEIYTGGNGYWVVEVEEIRA